MLALAEARSGRPDVARDRAGKLVDDPAAGFGAVTEANLALCEAALADDARELRWSSLGGRSRTPPAAIGCS